jgi:Tol biopolymer transport system component
MGWAIAFLPSLSLSSNSLHPYRMAGFFKQLKLEARPLDRVAVSLILGLSLVVGLLIVWGDRTLPKVRNFSWANELVGAADTAFTLTFNRPMNWESVAQGLQIAPALPGKTSWSGRRLVYTLTESVPYGKAFQLKLDQATGAKGGKMEPFATTFKSRDLAFTYLGVNGEEAGRLILYNVTQDQKTVLTPANLSVISFKTYPKGDRLLFTATERATLNTSEVSAKLYRVTTGTAPQTKPGEVDLVLDNQDYQILKFDLSADGDRIVVQRAARQNMGAANLWQIYQNGKPEPLKTQGGGDFLIAPDSQTLVVAQGQGLALVALNDSSTDKPLDFLPKFGMVLSFAKDGSAAAMLKFNTDYTRALYLVTNQGVQKELLRTKGSIVSAAFTAQRDALYCLLTRLLPGSDYKEQPYIAKIDLKTSQLTELLTLPIQQNITLSLAPDDSRLLLDQSLESALTPTPAQPDLQPTQPTQPLSSPPASNIWNLALSSQPRTAPTVVAVGTKPQWLP